MAEDDKNKFIDSIPVTKKPSRWALLAKKLKFTSAIVEEQSLKKASFFSTLLEKTSNTANRVLKFLDVMALDFSEHLKRLTMGTVILDFVFGFYEFIRIPVIYLTDWFLNGKIQGSASKNAQWFYRALLLGLALATYLFPPAAALVALVSALIILGKNIFSTANVFADRSAKQAQLHEITQRIPERAATLLDVAKQLDLGLAKPPTFLQVKTALEVLEKQLEEPKELSEEELSKYALCKLANGIVESLETLQSKKAQLQEKIAGMGTAQIVDRSVGVTLSTLVLMGILIGAATPLIGIGMLAGAGIVGVVYTATVIVMALAGSRDAPVKEPLSMPNSIHNLSMDKLFTEEIHPLNVKEQKNENTVTVEKQKNLSSYVPLVSKSPIIEQQKPPSDSLNLHK